MAPITEVVSRSLKVERHADGNYSFEVHANDIAELLHAIATRKCVISQGLLSAFETENEFRQLHKQYNALANVEKYVMHFQRLSPSSALGFSLTANQYTVLLGCWEHMSDITHSNLLKVSSELVGLQIYTALMLVNFYKNFIRNSEHSVDEVLIGELSTLAHILSYAEQSVYVNRTQRMYIELAQTALTQTMRGQ